MKFAIYEELDIVDLNRNHLEYKLRVANSEEEKKNKGERELVRERAWQWGRKKIEKGERAWRWGRKKSERKRVKNYYLYSICDMVVLS